MNNYNAFDHTDIVESYCELVKTHIQVKWNTHQKDPVSHKNGWNTLSAFEVIHNAFSN